MVGTKAGGYSMQLVLRSIAPENTDPIQRLHKDLLTKATPSHLLQVRGGYTDSGVGLALYYLTS